MVGVPQHNNDGQPQKSLSRDAEISEEWMQAASSIPIAQGTKRNRSRRSAQGFGAVKACAHRRFWICGARRELRPMGRGSSCVLCSIVTGGGCWSHVGSASHWYPPGVEKPAVIRTRGVLDRGCMKFLQRNERPCPALFSNVKESVDGCCITYVVLCVLSEKNSACRRRFYMV